MKIKNSLAGLITVATLLMEQH